jgi:hypothetical protein
MVTSSQEIPRLLCNLKVHYGVHKGMHNADFIVWSQKLKGRDCMENLGINGKIKE